MSDVDLLCILFTGGIYEAFKTRRQTCQYAEPKRSKKSLQVVLDSGLVEADTDSFSVVEFLLIARKSMLSKNFVCSDAHQETTTFKNFGERWKERTWRKMLLDVITID